MKLFSVASAAKEIGISRHAFAKYVEQGLIETVQFPDAKRPRITPEAIEAFIDRFKVGPVIGHTEQTGSAQTEANQAISTHGQKESKTSKDLWYQKYA